MTSQVRQKVLLGGSIVLLLVLAAAWVASRDRTTSLVSTLLYPDLAAAIPSVQRVTIATAEEHPAIELLRDGDAWTVKQREGYAADVGKIGVLLQDLAEARLLEEKTATAANYPALGVEDLATPGASGLRVEAFAADAATPLVDLIIGKQAGAQGTYARKSGEDASWLVSRVDVARLPGAWLAPNITHVDTDRVHQVVLRPAGKPAITFIKSHRGDADFAAQGRKLANPKAANGISTGLIALQLEDVRNLDSLDGQTPDARAIYRLFDGLVLEITGWREDDQYWIALVPSFDVALATRFADDKPEDHTGAAIWRTPEQVQQEIARLQPRVTGHAFRVPEYKYQSVFPGTDAWME